MNLAKKITYYVGAMSMFAAGIFYMLMSDLSFKNTSDRLIVAVLLSFGSAIFFFLSANFDDRYKWVFSFKGVGLALAIGFVVYIHLFQNSAFFLEVVEKLRKAGIAKEKDLFKTQLTMIVTLVLSYLSIAGQASNVVLECIKRDN